MDKKSAESNRKKAPTVAPAQASLWLLLSAKAALMTNNKSAEKLRKEFSMLSDFPAGEEAKLRQARL